ncbi:Uracil permease [Jeotgalicoccus aerolatus]|uniref:Uracil permease n=1 Tax=Jeotgalicoccus aerolatus TaxID=709510 RepID=A0ABS4HKJ7_9STAP|nr:solute carrier family 23 protein [Jeotgalicoccus aerolatus]MBP1951421.1 uracil permease [Jeotgalicoccus aerolatus]NMA82057.1 uracil permease [Jeotgalicoccus aerolatus]CAD2076732.1 Uracil permease [Jeotgalicoccus aerolatus]GGD97630.1 uracil permease [Jeotgalicoccus aerolatus]HJG33608.1 NCS2 family nucleobase:cation symporter [Jeotgalicoccus aerolatus]
MAKFEDEIYERTVEPELDVHERPKFFQGLLLSSQHLFAMFGATVLVPFLTGLPVSAALIASGIGTLLYILITKGQIPAYLGSSFAFILPITIALGANSLGEVLTALFFSGILYVIIGLVIRLAGSNWLIGLLPPIVVGPVIMVIGLGLAPVAVDMAMYTDSGNQEGYSMTYIIVALITLTITILASVFLKGVLGLIPILIGIIGGYITALLFGIVDLEPIKNTSWLAMPELYIPYQDYTPTMNLGLFMVMLPIVFVTISEHIGHQLVINKIVGRDFFKKPGLHRSIIGDGVATMFSSTIGGPPTTTYGENIGVLAITRIFSIWVIGGAAILAVILGFVGKFTAVVQSIPSPVMGGVSILLFGIIAASGLRMLVDAKIDFDNKRNLVIASVILVIGIGKAHLDFTIGNIPFNLEGMALAAVAGIILNLILPKKERN